MKKKLFLILITMVAFFSIFILKFLNGRSSNKSSISEIMEITKKWNGVDTEVYFYLIHVDRKIQRRFDRLGYSVGKTMNEMSLGITYGKRCNEEATEIYSLFDVLYYLQESGQLDMFQIISFAYNSSGYDWSGGGQQYTAIIVEEFKNMLKENEGVLNKLNRDEKVNKVCDMWIKKHNYYKYIRNKGFLNPLTNVIEEEEPDGFLWDEWFYLEFDAESISNPLE